MRHPVEKFICSSIVVEMTPEMSLKICLEVLLLVSSLLSADGNKVAIDVRVECSKEFILLHIQSPGEFNGMIYPISMPENGTCLVNYTGIGPNFTYELPLHHCDTLTRTVGNSIEYYNTMVIQPHHRLITTNGKGLEVKCRYSTHSKTMSSNFNVGAIGSTSVSKTAKLPRFFMKVFVGNLRERVLAKEVHVGENLTLVIGMENYDIYALKISNCEVFSGFGSSQALYDENGCPVDSDVMGPLTYSADLRYAYVVFQAHKFPFTSAVNYKCDLKFCVKHLKDCGQLPPICSPGPVNAESGVVIPQIDKDVEIPQETKDESIPQVNDEAKNVDDEVVDEDMPKNESHPFHHLNRNGEERQKDHEDSFQVEVTGPEQTKDDAIDVDEQIMQEIEENRTRGDFDGNTTNDGQIIIRPIRSVLTLSRHQPDTKQKLLTKNETVRVHFGLRVNDEQQARSYKVTKTEGTCNQKFCMSSIKLAVIVSLLTVPVLIFIAVCVIRINKKHRKSSQNDGCSIETVPSHVTCNFPPAYSMAMPPAIATRKKSYPKAELREYRCQPIHMLENFTSF